MSYATEADLCRDFIRWAKPQGWNAYAETAGFDIILVNAGGVQIGIQAKLRFNVTLLRQILPDRYWDGAGPDYRAVLVGSASSDGLKVCQATGLTMFRPRTGRITDCIDSSSGGAGEFIPAADVDVLKHHWNPTTRCRLPGYIPDVIAGAKSPVQLTPWKISALKVCARMELQGFITSKQIRQLGVDPRRWIHPRMGWLKAIDCGNRPGEYRRGPRLNFPEQHPEVYAQIKAEQAKLLEVA